MKRSERIVLVLSGAVASGLVGCGRESDDLVQLSADNVYTNNHYVRGAGYYHAPARAWYPYPHNSYWPDRGYYYSGTWNAYPDERSVAASKPTAHAITKATAEHRAHATTTRRGGFGSSTHSTAS